MIEVQNIKLHNVEEPDIEKGPPPIPESDK